jgi:hypothetical protein
MELDTRSPLTTLDALEWVYLQCDTYVNALRGERPSQRVGCMNYAIEAGNMNCLLVACDVLRTCLDCYFEGNLQIKLDGVSLGQDFVAEHRECGWLSGWLCINGVRLAWRQRSSP